MTLKGTIVLGLVLVLDGTSSTVLEFEDTNNSILMADKPMIVTKILGISAVYMNGIM